MGKTPLGQHQMDGGWQVANGLIPVEIETNLLPTARRLAGGWFTLCGSHPHAPDSLGVGTPENPAN